VVLAIVATARNEGPFLVEWIAHHLAIGFDRIFVATNDCDDGSDHLLDRLGRSWPVWHVPNDQPLDGLTTQRSAVRRCLDHPAFRDVTWALHIDIDEFLCLAPPVGSVAELIAPHADADALLLFWRLFGDDGRAVWSGGSILDGFLSCQAAATIPVHKVFWKTSSFADVAPHCPKQPLRPLDVLSVVTTRGTPVDPAVCAKRRGTLLLVPEEDVTWDRARINHYMHKSTDLSLLARDFRGDANGRPARKKRTPGHPEFEQYNRNEAEDRTIHAFRSGRIGIENRMLRERAVLAAHHRAMSWFLERLLVMAGGGMAEPGVLADVSPSHPAENSL
jgi:hypothetical protein